LQTTAHLSRQEEDNTRTQSLYDAMEKEKASNSAPQLFTLAGTHQIQSLIFVGAKM
jgi:hypothetical protein